MIGIPTSSIMLYDIYYSMNEYLDAFRYVRKYEHSREQAGKNP